MQNNDDVFMCDQVKYKKKQSEKHVLGEAARDACFERKLNFLASIFLAYISSKIYDVVLIDFFFRSPL